jgi:glycerol-1-phosphate dehydrogenase [NAD(P)+]
MKAVWNLPRIDLLTLAEIHEGRRAALVTSLPAWEAVRSSLPGLAPAATAFVREATLAHWTQLAAQVHQFRPTVVYAVGGGLAADAGKFIAHVFNVPAVCIPTALSVDAFFCPAVGIRESGCVRYLEVPPPERVLIDYAVLADAPVSLRAAGIADVLSIATGSWDWEFAERQGRNPSGMACLPWARDVARDILRGALDCAEAAGRADPGGLKQLLDCLCLETQLLNQIGHSRPEEGSEHYFAYCAEQFAGPGWPHADLLGPGILQMAERQGQDPAPLRMALEACHVPLARLGNARTRKTLEHLPSYCREHQLPYGIAHELSPLPQGDLT